MAKEILQNNQKVSVYYDIDEIVKFIIGDKSERGVDTEINENYVVDADTNNLDLVSKELREYKSQNFSESQQIRKELILKFVDMLENSTFRDNTDLTTDISFCLAYNGMKKRGFIKVDNE